MKLLSFWQFSRMRPLKIGLALGATTLILALIVIGTLFALRNSANKESNEASDSSLPTSPEQSLEDALNNSTSSSQLAATPAPSSSKSNGTVPTASPLPPKNLVDEKLAVTVNFQRSPQFTFSIADIKRTTGQVTIHHYTPPARAAFSIIKILDDTDQTIVEKPFYMATEAILEEVDPQTPQEYSVYELPSSSAYLVMDIPSGRTPARVELLTTNGTIYDEEVFDFSNLQSAVGKGTFWNKLARILAGFIPASSVKAQSTSIFTIVVINEIGAEKYLEETTRDTRAMLSIEPWATFHDANQVEVISILNKKPLGCTLIELLPGIGFPQCPNDGQIIAAVEEQVPQWDAIIVVTSANCKCGSMALHFPPIVTVGYNSTPALIVHELGHGVGKMQDEYLYKYNFKYKPYEPNCFLTRDACLAVVEDLDGEGGECLEGCADIYQWRPANRIMHNTYVPLRFGPVERCIMGQAIGAVVGTEYDCYKE